MTQVSRAMSATRRVTKAQVDKGMEVLLQESDSSQ